MKKLIFSFLVLISFVAIGNEDHKEHGHKDNHKDEERNEVLGDHDNHEEHEEKASENGFKLNPAGMKTFEIKLVKVTSDKIKVSKNAIYKGLNEVNLYRLREGLFKRIDFKNLSKEGESIQISSSDLKVGDEIVIQGVGFLRMAEIAATGGLSDSHSH